jgi:sugar phosphate isomerase/epimerase
MTIRNECRIDAISCGWIGVRILFSTGSVAHMPIESVFELVKEAGFDGCDLVLGPEFNDPKYRQRVTDCLRILPICSMHSPYRRVEAFGDQVHSLRYSVELAKELGSEVVTFHPPSWYDREFRFLRWFLQVKDFQRELSCDHVALALENMPLRRLVLPTYALNGFRRLIKFGMAHNLYFTYDITHMGSCGHDIVDALLLYMRTARLRNVHVSDYSLWREQSHLGIGRGELPIVRLLNTMKRLDYDACVTLELAPNELPRTKEWLSKVISYTCSYLRLQLGVSESGSAPP